ncbi:MAG TPA: glycosyltransferase family 39 protein, partial [Pyrinomonadaceae bacterium]|nr:glycosyltransferase family 39 protein [Pyrinomonadaceae bacterium]
MNTIFIILVVAVCGGTLFIRPSEAPAALAMCAVAALPTIIILARTPEQRTFLMRLFVLALLVRMILAVVIHVGHMEEFFGGDANTYDIFGQSLAEAWHGNEYHRAKYESFVASGASAWGMIYLVAAVYEVVGPNMLAIQLINAALGAATAIVIYHVAQTLFGNKRVSQVAAILVAFFPSMVL